MFQNRTGSYLAAPHLILVQRRAPLVGYKPLVILMALDPEPYVCG